MNKNENVSRNTRAVAVVGTGVIGSGWVARFLLAGWNVRVFDPKPGTSELVEATLQKARRFYPALYDSLPPQEGQLQFETCLESAVADVDWIQESIPERLPIKRDLYAAIQQFSRPESVIASSTSGFKPSDLQVGAQRPGEIIVVHPYNPVYLLPAVDLVCSPANPSHFSSTTASTLQEIGMLPLTVRSEIDAHIGDRLLEAFWREALWLINDDIATVEEIDKLITHSFGLRWAQMGLFETYRIAGGQGGLAHFLKQFAPCLELPWTKLTNTPTLDSALAEKIQQQSDQHSGDISVAELEEIRDTNLVTILRGLKSRNWGAGKFLRDVENQFLPLTTERAPTGPMKTVRRVIPPDWIDFNGHVNEARYLEMFSLATDRFLSIAGCDEKYIESERKSYFTIETHLSHRGETHDGETVQVESYCLFVSGKKLQLFHVLRHANGELLATGEHLLLHIDLDMRKSCLPDQFVTNQLANFANLHGGTTLPEGIVPKLAFK